MKTTTFLFVGFSLLFSIISASSQDLKNKNTDLQPESVSIMCSPDMQELTAEWVSHFSTLNPEVKINLINSTSTNELVSGKNLSFVSNKALAGQNEEELWKLVIGRNVTVPVINSGNPLMKELQKQGISQKQIIQIFKNPQSLSWGELLKSSNPEKVRIYVVDDETVKSGLQKFINENKFEYDGITLGTRVEVLSAIRKDPFAIGFCKLVDVQNTETYNLIDNINLLPIDKNGNGAIDYMENIYTDINAFHRGVWIGKYPKMLVSNIYVIRDAAPVNESEIDFLNWVLTDGQQFMVINGFSDLAGNESQSQLDKINIAEVNIVNDTNTYSLSKLLIGFLIIIGAGLVVSVAVRSYRKGKLTVYGTDYHGETGFSTNSLAVPNGLYFDKTHTWAFMEKDGLVSIGIDDFLQHVTGPVTRVEMKTSGEKIRKGELLFSIIQAGKQLDIFAPVSGVIKMNNEALISNTAVLNQSPYTEGWIYRIEPSNWFIEIQLLDMSEKYKKWLNAEFLRLKEFMAAILKPESTEYAQVILQDGGELKEGVLSDFGPEVWEDFQTNFLDTFK